jgi:hypothetical protein
MIVRLLPPKLRKSLAPKSRVSSGEREAHAIIVPARFSGCGYRLEAAAHRAGLGPKVSRDRSA